MRSDFPLDRSFSVVKGKSKTLDKETVGKAVTFFRYCHILLSWLSFCLR